MHIQVNGAATYCYTGGKPFDAAKPTVVFIHGVLNDHSVWALQSRYMANHGWNVLAIDLPGHCKSGGDAPATVEQGAEFIGALLAAAGVQRAALVGHSWGSLIAMEAAARLGDRISHLVLVGTAFPMKVSPALIEASQADPEKALRMVNVFSRSTLAAPPSALGPGTWVFGAGMALGRKVLRSNPAVNVFHRGFVAFQRDLTEAVYLADRVAVMTARPGRVTRMQPIHLPRPRPPDLTTTVAFTTLKAQLLAALRQESPAGQPEGGP